MPKSPLWLALAWREVSSNRAFSLGFVLNLSLGLIGFLTLDAFKGSIQHHLDENSRTLLGGDIVVGAQRAFTAAEQDIMARALPAASRIRRETATLSMVVHGPASRLVELKAIDQDYPFYGVPRLRSGRAFNHDMLKELTEQASAWIDPELMVQLGLDVGKSIAIGNLSFVVKDVMEFDPAVGAQGMAIAPKVFIGLPQLDATGLLAKGSRARASVFIALPPGAAADPVAKVLTAGLGRSEVRVRTHREASEDLNRVLIYLNDYLGLVALVALFLAGVGGAYLFRTFLQRRMKELAILMSLGLEVAIAQRIYLAQLVILGLAATALASIFALAMLPLLPLALSDLMPQGLVPELQPGSLGIAALMGLGGSVLVCLPLLQRLALLKPATLFQESGGFALELRHRNAIAWIPVLLAYWLLAVLTAHSFKVGTLFIVIFLGSTLIFAATGLLFLRLLARPWRSWPMVFEMAALNLARHRLPSLVSFVAIGLGSLLVSLVPQVRTLILSELSQAQGSPLPSLFLFDIQEEQLSPLTATLQAEGVDLSFVSPLVRAQLTAINGAPLSQALPPPDGPMTTREDEQAERTVNRGYNLSYRAALFPSEELVSGRGFSGAYSATSGAIPEISLELRFAKRLGVGLGDHLSFEVQGVPVEGVVVNTRRVRWTSFQPNFFVQFQPGILDDAPKTFIASIPERSAGEKSKLQTLIVAKFPNISVVDVDGTIERILGIVRRMAKAVSLMAALALVAGLAVLFAIAHDQAERRIPDVTLLKVLGSRFSKLYLMTVLEFGILGATASGIGASLSIAGVYAFASLDLAGPWRFDGLAPFAVWIGVTILCTLTGLGAIGRSLGAKPLSMLGGDRR